MKLTITYIILTFVNTKVNTMTLVKVDFLCYNPSMDNKLGENIKAARKRNGITQAELAARLNVSQARIAQYENGHRIPKFETVFKIMEALEEWNLEDFYDVTWPEDRAPLSPVNDAIMIERFHRLNSDGQEKVISYAADLAENPKYSIGSGADPEGQEPK